MKQCIQCDLSQHRTQVVVGDYGPKQGLCFIGEGPGAEEDRQGRPFVGRSGQLLDRMLQTIDLDRDQVSVLNIVKCRPPNNRNPSNTEQNTCGSLWLQPQLQYLEPTLLITLGSVALNYFYPKKRITKVKGQILAGQSPAPVFPMFHPAYVLRGGSTRDAYEQDFRDLLRTYKSIQSGDIDPQSQFQTSDATGSGSSSSKKSNRDQSTLDQYF